MHIEPTGTELLTMPSGPRPRSILARLSGVVMLGLLPGWVTVAAITYRHYVEQRQSIEQGALERTRALSQAVDRDLAAGIALLQGLATSPFLTDGNFDAFRNQASSAIAEQQADVLGLSDASGRQFVNTLLPNGDKLPRTDVPELVRTIFETGRPGISGYFVGPITHKPQADVGVPVLQDGRVAYALIMNERLDRLAQILKEQQPNPEWVISIFDQQGTILARTHSAAQFIGKKASPERLQQFARFSEGTGTATSLEGTPVLYAFTRSGTSGWVTGIAVPLALITREIDRRLWVHAVVFLATLLLTGLLAWQQALRIANSIRALKEPALQLASDVPIALPPTAITETLEVGSALLDAKQVLIERTRARDRAIAQAHAREAELARVARVSIAGELASGIAHEVGQPLTSAIAYMRGCLRLLAQQQHDPGLLRDGLAQAAEQAERAGEVLLRLRDFVTRKTFEPKAVPVAALIGSAVRLMRTDAASEGVAIEIHASPDLPHVYVDEVQIEQVLLNLLRNAVDAMKGENVMQPSISIEAHEFGVDRIEICVSDNGPGVPVDAREKIFQPFETSKPNGMGLGLAISRTIVQAHGGELRLSPARLGGATFAFDLPIATRSHFEDQIGLA